MSDKKAHLKALAREMVVDHLESPFGPMEASEAAYDYWNDERAEELDDDDLEWVATYANDTLDILCQRYEDEEDDD